MARKSKTRDRHDTLEGRLVVEVRQKGVLIDVQEYKNLILYQGQAEILRTLFTTTPSTKPRIITRMAIGDQGTIPSNTTIPKVPVKTLTGLYHEIYRKDFDSTVPTIYSPVGFSYTGDVTIGLNTIDNLSSIAGVTSGLIVVGTGIPLGAVVVDILSSSSISFSGPPATSTNIGEIVTFSGVINEVQGVAEFNASDVPLAAFTNPSTPMVNEVGLVIIDPTAIAGISRAPTVPPTIPSADEIIFSIRTFNSVPFVAANDISITIKYTIFTQ